MKWLLQFFLILILAFPVISCTSKETGEETAIEDELNSELGDVGGDSLDDFGDELAEDDGDFLEDSDAGGDDDSFLSGDDDSSGGALANEDLESELNQDVGASGMVDNAPIPAYPEEPPPMIPNPAPPMQSGMAPIGPITSKESFPRNEDFEALNINEPNIPKEDLGEPAPLVAEVDPPPPSLEAARQVVPISKMSTDPFFRNQRLMNTLYIARPGDDMATVSEKIFGANKIEMLYADNSELGKTLEPGDKIYYTSPNRPEDRKTIMTFYEDNHMSPQYYTTIEGDDIQRIGKRLLGFDEAWREIYATNESLQTQALLPAGLQIRYWTGNELKGSEVDNELAAAPVKEIEQPVTSEEEPPSDIAAEPIAPPGEQLLEMPPPDDPMVSGSSSDGDVMPLPPEVIGDSLPAVGEPESSSNTSLFTVAGIALVLLAGAAIVAIQIKNRKKVPTEDEEIPPSLEFTKV